MFTDSLPSNGHPIHAHWLTQECVYRVVAYQWVYKSQYFAMGFIDLQIIYRHPSMIRSGSISTNTE
jgi:hypothetical protein